MLINAEHRHGKRKKNNDYFPRTARARARVTSERIMFVRGKERRAIPGKCEMTLWQIFFSRRLVYVARVAINFRGERTNMCFISRTFVLSQRRKASAVKRD